MKTITLILPCFLLAMAFATAQDGDYSFKEKYSVASPVQLDVSSFDGNIDVSPSSTNEIQVYYIARKNGHVLKINREELEKEVILNVEPGPNGLRIEVKNKFENQSWFNSMDQVHVSFRILTPSKTACDLHSSDGNLSIEGLTSDQKLKTSDGNIQIAGINGNIRGNTSDGNIRAKEVKGSVDIGTSDGNIQLEKIAGDVTSTTSDGNIELTQVRGDVNAKTSDGDIYFTDISGSFRGKTSDGNIRGNFVELKKELTLNTGDGNISVRIPGNLGLDLDIRGESLNVPLNNFSGKSEKKYIQGKSNGGGIAVSLATSDGHITLEYL